MCKPGYVSIPMDFPTLALSGGIKHRKIYIKTNIIQVFINLINFPRKYFNVKPLLHCYG